MYLQYKKYGWFSDEYWGFQGGGYLFGERMYQVQSLVSKSLLLWLVFGGAWFVCFWLRGLHALAASSPPSLPFL